MHEVNWHKLDGSKAAINAPNELVDGRTEVLILLNVLARWHCELYQDNLTITVLTDKVRNVMRPPPDLAYPLWMLSQEELEGMELLRYALDIV